MYIIFEHQCKLGKERVFLSIAQAIGLQIWASNEKKKIFKATEDNNILERLSDSPNNAGIHVIEMEKVKNCEFLNEYLTKYSSHYNQILSVIPTGWTHQKGSSSENSLKSMNIKTYKHKFCNVSQLEVPYSEHSSFSELRRFVMFLKLANTNCVIPTVNVGNANSRESMTKHFKEWILDGSNTPLNIAHNRFAQFVGN